MKKGFKMCLGTDKQKIDLKVYYAHESYCLVCGSPFHIKRKGRSREYCSDICKNFIKYKNALESTILKIDFKGKYSNQARSDIFGLANLIKIKN